MLTDGILNLLKVIDLPPEERANLVKLGLGEILTRPFNEVKTTGIVQERLSLDLERADPLKASKIYFQFLVYKTAMNANLEGIPKRVFFQMRFFSFPEIQTDSVSLINPAVSHEDV